MASLGCLFLLFTIVGIFISEIWNSSSTVYICYIICMVCSYVAHHWRKVSSPFWEVGRLTDYLYPCLLCSKSILPVSSPAQMQATWFGLLFFSDPTSSGSQWSSPSNFLSPTLAIIPMLQEALLGKFPVAPAGESIRPAKQVGQLQTFTLSPLLHM